VELNTKQGNIQVYIFFPSSLRNLLEFRKHIERNIQRSSKKYFWNN